jgi:arginine N-succinyltransferase
MEFPEADRLSAATDNQFILDLMPKYPIYAELLPAEAQAVIGRCHPDGEGARRLLEWEGYRYADVVDIFDAGPLMTAPRDHVRTVREARRRTARVVDRLAEPARRALLSAPDPGAFGCVAARAILDGEAVRITAAAADALGVETGASLIAWVDDDG